MYLVPSRHPQKKLASPQSGSWQRRTERLSFTRVPICMPCRSDQACVWYTQQLTGLLRCDRDKAYPPEVFPQGLKKQTSAGDKH